MTEEQNIYGIQKVEPTEVRTGRDIAGTTGMAAMQGAKDGGEVGAMFGPKGRAIGMGVGAATYGTVGFLAAKAGQKEERRRAEQDESYNKGVAMLQGRALREQRVIGAQARYGMKNTNKYQVAEIEGDGSMYRDGIGEIHTDKNFNIKTIANGSPTHEEGGTKILAEEGDIVFPTQMSKAKYNKILADIKKYKLQGDERAKKRLELERDKLPTDEDYARYGAKYKDGVGDIEVGDEESFMELENFIRHLEEREGKKFDTPEEQRKFLEEKGYGAKEQKRLVTAARNAGYDVGPANTGKAAGPMFMTNFTNEFIKSKETNSPDNLTSRYLQTDPKTRTYAASPEKGPVQQTEDATKSQEKAQDNSSKKQFDLNRLSGLTGAIDANILHNLSMGSSPAEKVTRRYFNPEFQKYRDLSDAQRRSAMEQRNFESRANRGDVNRSRSQSLMAQSGSRYLKTMENINQAESARQYQTDVANTNLINETNMKNLGLALTFDEQDAMNRAAKQSYTDRAFADMSTLGRYREQQRYMESRDQAMMERDQYVIDKGLINSKNAAFDINEGAYYSGRFGQLKRNG